jgi:hypothetical protein
MLDGTVRGTAGTFNLSSAGLTAGQHTLTLTVTDNTAMVRNDPSGLLREQQTWTITVEAGGALPGTPTNPSPANGATNVGVRPVLAWNAAANAASYDIYLGTSAGGTTKRGSTTATSIALEPLAGTLSTSTQYFWRIVAVNGNGSTSSSTWSFTTSASVSAEPLRLVAVTPCRLADTRPAEGLSGAFGPPALAAQGIRTVPVPSGRCGIPATARAYCLNVTVVPPGPLAYLTIWPAGQSQPLVSTLNSFEGKVVANAAIVPAGSGGAINVFVTNLTDAILDVTCYFAP